MARHIQNNQKVQKHEKLSHKTRLLVPYEIKSATICAMNRRWEAICSMHDSHGTL